MNTWVRLELDIWLRTNFDVDNSHDLYDCGISDHIFCWMSFHTWGLFYAADNVVVNQDVQVATAVVEPYNAIQNNIHIIIKFMMMMLLNQGDQVATAVVDPYNIFIPFL